MSESNLKQRSKELLSRRKDLPIWGHAGEIRDKAASNDVLLLVGETGSGKSTQIPQFLLPICQKSVINGGAKIGGRIAITQPRRMAAISLAKRVAAEMGSPLGKGSPASQVGYSVRFDNNVSSNTRVKFVTDGTLLQEIVRDPWLKEYSVVVVDEVHERGVNNDLVLGFLKRLIDGRRKDDGRGGKPLKVVVMSATADMEKIQAFFEQPAPGLTITNSIESENTATSIKVASCYIKGRQFPVKIHYVPIPVTNVLDAALDRITYIHRHEPLPGDILVFLPGQETIETLESMCVSYSQSLIANSKKKGEPKLPKLLVLPLFAALPTVAQQRIFDPTPPFTRRVILSTNIAETSVTVPGIRHVIDTGKRKARFFRPTLNLDTLLTKAISRSSAAQRAGRAGREAAGTCYRLYTEKTFYELDADTEPEILRCDLAQLVLILKSHRVDDIPGFPLLTPPPEKSLKRACLTLLRLQALGRKDGCITKLGKKMSTLPLPANLARALLASQLPEYDCLSEMIDIVSGLSVENIWLPIHNTPNQVRHEDPWADTDSPNLKVGKGDVDTFTTNGKSRPEGEDNDDEEGDQNPIAQARKTLYRREGDHLTLLAAIQAYVQENTDRKDWCRRHGTSHRAMTSAMDVRKQLRKILMKETSSDDRSVNDDHKHDHAPLKVSQPKRTDHESNQPKRPSKKPKLTNEEKTSTAEQTDHTTADIHGTSAEHTAPTPPPPPDKASRILRALLLGLIDNTASLASTQSQSQSQSQSQTPTGSKTTAKNIWIGPYTTLSTSRKNLQIHPSSVLFARNQTNRPAYIMFSEFVVTERAYARCVSAIEGRWVEEWVDMRDGDV